MIHVLVMVFQNRYIGTSRRKLFIEKGLRPYDLSQVSTILIHSLFLDSQDALGVLEGDSWIRIASEVVSGQRPPEQAGGLPGRS
jgi:hypothetical protein